MKKGDCQWLYLISEKIVLMLRINETGSDWETYEYDSRNKRVSFKNNTSFYVYFSFKFI